MDDENNSVISGLDIRGTEAGGLTIDFAWNLGKALADWLPTAGSVVVAGAPTQDKLKAAIIEGLRLQGRNAVDGGTTDKGGVVSYIKTMGLSGGVAIAFDELENMNTIELYREDGRLIDAQTGLNDIGGMVQAGNFVPAVTKGELTAIA